MTLPEDPMLVLRAINEGVPFIQNAPQSALSRAIIGLAEVVAGESPTAEVALVGTANGSAAAGKRFGRWMPTMARRRD